MIIINLEGIKTFVVKGSFSMPRLMGCVPPWGGLYYKALGDKYAEAAGTTVLNGV